MALYGLVFASPAPIRSCNEWRHSRFPLKPMSGWVTKQRRLFIDDSSVFIPPIS
jgi:hypothetical protein